MADFGQIRDFGHFGVRDRIRGRVQGRVRDRVRDPKKGVKIRVFGVPENALKHVCGPRFSPTEMGPHIQSFLGIFKKSHAPRHPWAAFHFSKPPSKA